MFEDIQRARKDYLSQDEAVRLKHNHIGTEHLFWVCYESEKHRS